MEGTVLKMQGRIQHVRGLLPACMVRGDGDLGGSMYRRGSALMSLVILRAGATVLGGLFRAVAAPMAKCLGEGTVSAESESFDDEGHHICDHTLSHLLSSRVAVWPCR